jgi:hypothetical protein
MPRKMKVKEEKGRNGVKEGERVTKKKIICE